MFVAVVKFCVVNAPLPIATDILPRVSEPSAFFPMATFMSASVNASPAKPPIKTLSMPVVTDSPASA